MTGATTRMPSLRVLLALLVCHTWACTPSEGELLAAARSGDLDTLRRGLREHSGATLQRALREAVGSDQREAAELLLASSNEPMARLLVTVCAGEYQPDRRQEPLEVSPTMAVVLLDAGAPGNQYLLPHAIRTGDLELARAVLEHHLVTERIQREGAVSWLEQATTRAYVIREDHTISPEIAGLLVQRGADAGQLFIEAARTGSLALMTAVLDAGGDGELALGLCLDDARVRNRPRLVQALLERGARIPRALTLAANFDDIETIRLLLDHGSTDIESALINARRQGNAEIIALLEARLPPRTGGGEV